MYQHETVSLAGHRMNTGVGPDIAFIARRLFWSVPDLSSKEREFLQDVGREEVRYQFVGLNRLIALSRRSVKPDDREALAECIRAHSISGLEVVKDFSLALTLETTAQGPADVSTLRFSQIRSTATWEQAVRDTTTHLYGARALLDALHANRC